jgi:GR25 family glycosyltransferase involved in LPS biosynthesis
MLLIVLFVSFSNFSFSLKEGLTSSSNTATIRAYVISLRHENRLRNIEEQQRKLSFEVEIFDAVKGDKLDLSKVENLRGGHYATVPEDYWKRRTVGCYLSHLNIMKMIKEKNYQGYTIVFEDDFKITTTSFYDDVMQIINTCNENQYKFDLIILGNKNDNRGQNLKDNIYTFDKSKVSYGTHGYIVNNSHVDKIINAIKFIDYEIDVKYSRLAADGKLDILMIYPYLVFQQPEKFSSEILDKSIETFVSFQNV